MNIMDSDKLHSLWLLNYIANKKKGKPSEYTVTDMIDDYLNSLEREESVKVIEEMITRLEGRILSYEYIAACAEPETP